MTDQATSPAVRCRICAHVLTDPEEADKGVHLDKCSGECTWCGKRLDGAEAAKRGFCDEACRRSWRDQDRLRSAEILGQAERAQQRRLVQLGVPSAIAEALSRGAATWVGARAFKAGSADRLLAYPLPEGLADKIKDGTECAHAGVSVIRPQGVDDKLERRVRSALRKVAEEAVGALPMPAIRRIVRFVELTRATFELDLELGGITATVAGLTGQQLLSYAVVRGRAAEHGLMLPTGKGVGARWEELLTDALPHADVRLPDAETTAFMAVRAEVRRVLNSAETAEQAADLARGLVYRDDERVAVLPSYLVSAVRQTLADDRPTRALIGEATKSMGRTGYRPRMEGSRPKLWAFDVERMNGQD